MFVVATTLTALGLGLLWWRGKDAPPAVVTLGVIPCGLLLLTLPVPWLMVRVTTTFQQIAATGSNSLPLVGGILLDVDRTLLWASIGVAIIVAAALGRQFLLARDGPQSLADSADAEQAPPPSTWRERTLAWALVAIVPAVAALVIASDIPRLVAGPGLDLAIAPPASTPQGARGLSETIAARLIAGTVAGIFAIVVAALAVVATIAVAGSAIAADRLRRLAWVVAILVMVGSAGNAVRLADEIGWIRGRFVLAAEAESRRRAAPPLPEGSASTAPGDDRVFSIQAKPTEDGGKERNARGLTLRSLRTDGVYFSTQKFGDNFHFWKFNPDGTCVPGAAPSEATVFIPPPPPAGMQWKCGVVDDRLLFSFTDGVNPAMETIRGAILSRELIRLDGVDYRFKPTARRAPGARPSG